MPIAGFYFPDNSGCQWKESQAASIHSGNPVLSFDADALEIC